MWGDGKGRFAINFYLYRILNSYHKIRENALITSDFIIQYVQEVTQQSNILMSIRFTKKFLIYYIGSKITVTGKQNITKIVKKVQQKVGQKVKVQCFHFSTFKNAVP